MSLPIFGDKSVGAGGLWLSPSVLKFCQLASPELRARHEQGLPSLLGGGLAGGKMRARRWRCCQYWKIVWQEQIDQSV